MPGRLILEVEPRSVSAHPIFNPPGVLYFPGRAIFSLAVLYFPYCERRSHYGKYRKGGAFDTPTQSATNFSGEGAAKNSGFFQVKLAFAIKLYLTFLEHFSHYL